jgi:hypothetical protein
VIPLSTLSQTLQEYAEATTSFVQSIGTLEGLLASDSKSFKIPWQNDAVGMLNYEIRQGGTGSIALTDSRMCAGMSLVRSSREILEIVRHRALTEITKGAAPEQLATKIVEGLPAVPSSVDIQGSRNQVIVGSPGASATLTIDAGDWSRYLMHSPRSASTATSLKNSTACSTSMQTSPAGSCEPNGAAGPLRHSASAQSVRPPQPSYFSTSATFPNLRVLLSAADESVHRRKHACDPY